ncbi:MAG: hypothetical protein WCJ74_01570 [bacterium]
MNKITKTELVMVAIAVIILGTIYGIWRIQKSEDNLIPSTSVQRVEKKQRAEKPSMKEEGFDVKGRIKVSLDKE